MARCFVPNFDFEHQLVSSSATGPQNLKRLNAELATSWVAVAEDGDSIWLPEEISIAFFDQCSASGLARIQSRSDVPEESRCEPWGWSVPVHALCNREGWQQSAPPQASVRAANSRNFSAELERIADLALPGAGPVVDLDEVVNGVQQLCRHQIDHLAAAWVIKANFGMSGRERIVGRGPLTPSGLGWVRKRLQRDGVVFLEPWVTRIREVGLQFQVVPGMVPELIGAVPLLSTAAGQYLGSWFSPPEAVASETPVPQSIVEACRAAAVHAADIGYHGPLGIDAMCYRGADGEPVWRPLQDINARWTMGRLSLGLRRLLRPGQSGLWWHGTAPERLQLADSPLIQEICESHRLRVSRIVSTSPMEVGGRPSHHASAAILFDATEPAAD